MTPLAFATALLMPFASSLTLFIAHRFQTLTSLLLMGRTPFLHLCTSSGPFLIGH